MTEWNDSLYIYSPASVEDYKYHYIDNVIIARYKNIYIKDINRANNITFVQVQTNRYNFCSTCCWACWCIFLHLHLLCYAPVEHVFSSFMGAKDIYNSYSARTFATSSRDHRVSLNLTCSEHPRWYTHILTSHDVVFYKTCDIDVKELGRRPSQRRALWPEAHPLFWMRDLMPVQARGEVWRGIY